jgi:hypothetical protein
MQDAKKWFCLRAPRPQCPTSPRCWVEKVCALPPSNLPESSPRLGRNRAKMLFILRYHACSQKLIFIHGHADDGMDTEDCLQSSSVQPPAAAPARMMFAQDCLNANNAQYCVEYSHEIFDHLLATEANLMPSFDYIDKIQHDINATMRGILIDWLVEVAEEYKLTSENLYLSTNYVDRYLTIMPVLRGKLQLVGVSCMLIASKYEEIFAPQVEDFVYITDNTYTSAELLHMETIILKALRFNLTAVTPYTFLQRILSLLNCTEQVKHLSAYLAEITIQEYHFLKYQPSTIALSAVILAFYSLDLEPLPDTLRLILKVSSTGHIFALLRALAFFFLKLGHNIRMATAMPGAWHLSGNRFVPVPIHSNLYYPNIRHFSSRFTGPKSESRIAISCLQSLKPNLLQVWGRSMEDIRPCVRDLYLVQYKVYDKSRTLQASFEKYSHQRWSCVSLIAPKQVSCPPCCALNKCPPFHGFIFCIADNVSQTTNSSMGQLHANQISYNAQAIP